MCSQDSESAGRNTALTLVIRPSEQNRRTHISEAKHLLQDRGLKTHSVCFSLEEVSFLSILHDKSHRLLKNLSNCCFLTSDTASFALPFGISEVSRRLTTPHLGPIALKCHIDEVTTQWHPALSDTLPQPASSGAVLV